MPKSYVKPCPLLPAHRPAVRALLVKAIDAVKKQGRPALDYGACAYRTLDGYACAVGLLVTDEEYSAGQKRSEFDDLEAEAPAEFLAICGVPAPVKASDWLNFLQRCHDTPAKGAYWGEPEAAEDAAAGFPEWRKAFDNRATRMLALFDEGRCPTVLSDLN